MTVLAGGCLFGAGRALYAEDPLRTADAIFVLSGSNADRWLEATDLYGEGIAPVIYLSLGGMDGGQRALTERGVKMPNGAEIARGVMLQLGLPPEAIVIPPRQHDNTAQEASTVRELSASRRWRTVIVVTSRFHTRRARFAMRRTLSGTGVDVIMRASRYDGFSPDHWWRSRSDVRMVLFEMPKLISYVCGLGE